MTALHFSVLKTRHLEEAKELTEEISSMYKMHGYNEMHSSSCIMYLNFTANYSA